jgi:YVTN family beta-propeller protein
MLVAMPALASTGTLLVVNKSDNTLSMLNLATGQAMATLPTGNGPHEVGVSPDGTIALVSNYGPAANPGNSLTVINIAAAEVVDTIDLGGYRRPHGLSWLPDNRHALVTVEDSRAVLLVDIERGKIIWAIATDEPVSHMVAVDPAGKNAYVTNIGSGSISVVDIEGGILKATVKVGNGTEGIAISADGRQLWATNRESDTVVVMDPATMKIHTTLGSIGFPIRVTLSPDGQEALVSRAYAGRVEFYNTQTLQSAGEVSMPSEYSLSNGRWLGGGFGYRPLPIGIIYHPNGESAYVANSYGGYIAVIDIAARQVTGTLHAGAEPDGLAYSHLMPGKSGAGDE